MDQLGTTLHDCILHLTEHLCALCISWGSAGSAKCASLGGGGADPIYSNAPLTALVTGSESGRSSRTPVHWLLDRQHTRSIVLVRLLADKAANFMKLPSVGSSMTSYRISGCTLQHSRCSTGTQQQCCSASQRAVLMLKTRMSFRARSTRSVTCSDSTRQTQVGMDCCSEFLAKIFWPSCLSIVTLFC